MKVVAIIQARMGSTRLPGKVMEEVGGKPLLEILINRLKKSKCIDEIIVATTLNEIDKRIVKLSKKLGIKCYCGSENDVLNRYLKTAEKFNAEVIIRITADNPLTDPIIVDKLVNKHLKSESDYTYCDDSPLGVSVEVFNKSTLKESSMEDLSDVEREHVTLNIKSNPQKFKITKFNSYLNHKHLRVTVDVPEDLELIKMIYNHFESLEEINTKNLINFFEEDPKMVEINKNIKQISPKSFQDSPLISVIIRTHNSESYVKKSLDSVTNQTLDPELYEIIVVDDGSTDKTLDILEKYSNRIIIIKENFLDPIKALNRGIITVNSEFFIILDSDDMLELNTLKEFFNLSKNDYFDFAYSDYFEVDAKTGSKKIVSLRDNIFDSIAGGIVFRRSVVNKVGGYAEDLFFPEYDLLIKLIKKGYKSKYVPKPLYNYFRREGSLTSNKRYVDEGFEQLYQKYGKIDGLRHY